MNVIKFKRLNFLQLDLNQFS